MPWFFGKIFHKGHVTFNNMKKLIVKKLRLERPVYGKPNVSAT